jgi:hypothetical protein
MSGGEEGARAEEAKRAAFAARHAAAQRAREEAGITPPGPKTPPPEPRTPRALVRQALRGSRRLAGRVYRQVVAHVPGPVRQHRLAEPVKQVIRAYRRRRGGPPPAAPRPLAFTGAPVVGPQAEVNRAAALARHRFRPAPAASSRAPAISALILNRDGAEHLQKLFASVAAHERGTDLELVVVDHGSTDASRAVIARWAGRLDVQAILLDENDSFSASTNRAARAARGERLLLLNNDIIFTRPILERVVGVPGRPPGGDRGPRPPLPGLAPRAPGGAPARGHQVLPRRPRPLPPALQPLLASGIADGGRGRGGGPRRHRRLRHDAQGRLHGPGGPLRGLRLRLRGRGPLPPGGAGAGAGLGGGARAGGAPRRERHPEPRPGRRAPEPAGAEPRPPGGAPRVGAPAGQGAGWVDGGALLWRTRPSRWG